MKNVTDTTKEAWRNGMVSTCRVVLNGSQVDNSDIYSKSIKVNKSICDDSVLKFVGCIPASLEIQIKGIDANCVGQSIAVYDTAGTTEEMKRFEGTIYKAVQDSAKEWTKITAYDSLFEINNANVSEWYSGLAFPMTLKQFRDSFFAYLGINQATQVLINDDVEIEETIGGEDISGSVIISNICQLNAVFGIVNDSNQFEYRSIETTTEVITTSQIEKFQYEDYTTEYIDKVVVRQDPEDIGAIVGTGENAYIIEGNFICYGKSGNDLETIANRIYNAIYQIAFVPFECKAMALPYLEAGDTVIIIKPDQATVTSIILSRKITGDSSLWDEFKAKGAKVYAEAVKNQNDELIQLRGQSNRLTRTVEGMTVEVATIREDYASKSMLQQTSDELSAQIEYLQSEIDGEVQIYNTEETPTLLNYPAWDFTYNIPVNNTVQTTDDLKFEYTEEYYKKNLRSVAYDEVNNLAYRFQKVGDGFGWVEIADTEFAVIMQRLSSLEITAEQIETQVLEIQQSYTTRTEVSSRITQSANEITQEVASTYATKTTTNSMQSQINQQASQISAKVSQTGGQSSTFGWELTSSAFSLKSQNQEVFRASSNGITIKGNFDMTGGRININSTTSTDNNLINLRRDYGGISRFTRITEGSILVTGQNGSVSIDDGKLNATSVQTTLFETVDLVVKSGTVQSHITPSSKDSGFVIPSNATFRYGTYISTTSQNLKYSAEAGGYVFATLPTFQTGYLMSVAPVASHNFVYSV